MAIDPSIALQSRGVQLENPLSQFANYLQAQSLQNDNALAPLKLQQMQLANQKAQQNYNFLSPIFDRIAAQRSAQTQQAQQQPMNALAGGGQQTGAPQQGGNALTQDQGLSMDELQAMALGGIPGAKESFDMYKYRNDGVKHDAGSYSEDPVTHQMRYFDKPEAGIHYDPNTRQLSKIDGSEVIADLAGQNKNAEMKAVNDNTLLPLDRMVKGQVAGGTVGQAVASAQGQVSGGPVPPAGIPPIPPQLMAKINEVKASGNPQETQSFITTLSKAITDPTNLAKNGKTPEQGQAALAHFLEVMGQGSQQPSGSPQQAAAPEGNGYMSAADMEADKLSKLNQVKMTDDPLIKFKTDLLSKAHDSNASTLGKLQDTVRSEFEIQNRNKQLLPMLDKIQTGGFNPEGRIALANSLQTSGMVPDSLKPKLGEWLANGDPTTGKVVENQLAAAGIKTMLDTLDKEGKPNRAIFEAIQNAQESVKSGNATLKQVFGLQKQLYDMHYQQEQDMSKAIASPSYNPLTMQADFSKRRNDSLSAPAQAQAPMQQGQAKPLTAAPTAPKGWALHVDASGNKAYVSPDGKQFQEVK